mgnify:FL=1|jgi:hypothetical protein
MLGGDWMPSKKEEIYSAIIKTLFIILILFFLGKALGLF